MIRKVEGALRRPLTACVVGCSDGKFVLPLLRRGHAVSAYDIDAVAIFGGEKTFPQRRDPAVPRPYRDYEQAEGFPRLPEETRPIRGLRMRVKAERLEAEYDRLNFRDDQFDISDVFLSIAVALAAVAALVDSFWLLYVAWGSGALGLFTGLAGFLGLNFRPEWIAQILGT